MTESRQVRRARERSETKANGAVQAQVDRIIGRVGSPRPEMYEAKRYEEGVSPKPHDSAHPGRYPKHDDPEKGQVWGGECNVTRCDNRNAVYWNLSTYGLYCPQCAKGVNGNDANPLCIRVEAKPALKDMDALRKERLGY